MSAGAGAVTGGGQREAGPGDAAVRGSVLVVDDDEDIRLTLRELLEDEKYDVWTAQNGQVALDLLRRAAHLPSLILLDLMMPVKDGFAFRTEQRADPKLAAVPVIVMSAAADLRAKSARLGVAHHLCKPVDLDTLLAAIARFAA